MPILFLFNIFKGEEKLSEKEISESIFIKLKPIAVAIYSIVILIVGGTIWVYSLYTQVQENKMTKLSVYEYRSDRRADSLSADSYRKDVKRDLKDINDKLDLLMQHKLK